MTRHCLLLAVLISGVLVLGMNLRADQGLKDETVQGTVIRAGEARLTLVDSFDNAIHKFAVASDAVISRDGRNVKLEEVSLGDFALVSVKANPEIRIATVIVALSPSKVSRADP